MRWVHFISLTLSWRILLVHFQGIYEIFVPFPYMAVTWPYLSNLTAQWRHAVFQFAGVAAWAAPHRTANQQKSTRFCLPRCMHITAC